MTDVLPIGLPLGRIGQRHDIFFRQLSRGNRKHIRLDFIRHQFDGIELKHDYARHTLQNLQRLWGRPVALQTVVDEKSRILSFDGEDFEEKDAADRVA